MPLDLPTLMLMQSFAMGCAGAALLLAWLQNRGEPVLALWGFASLMASAGILNMFLTLTLHQPAWAAAGGIMLSFQLALDWKAARAVDAKPAPWVLVVLGLFVEAAAGLMSASPGLSAQVALAVGVIYSSAAAATLWLGRTERLTARDALVALFALHAVVLLVAIYGTRNGLPGQNLSLVPTTLFSFLRFESIIFVLFTAVFAFALVKERNEAAARQAARTDSLTGVANRAGFMAAAERAVERCRRDGAPFAVMMFDLDRFKSVNDNHGHAVGDLVLQKFCEVVIDGLRPSDLFGRIGGEEFAALLPGSGVEAAFIRADRLRAAFAAACRFIGHRQVDATVSCGVADGRGGGQTLASALHDADAALYEAKAEGRNRVKRAAPTGPDKPRPAVIRVA